MDNIIAQDNSFLWIFALLILAGGGFGNMWGNKANTTTDAMQNEILSGQKFDALSRQVNQIGDGLCSSTYSLNNSILGVQSNLGNAISTEGRNIQSQLCAINSNIDNKFASLEKSQLEQRIAEQAQQITQLQMAQQLCGVPKVNPYMYSISPNCGCTGLATI